MLSNLVFILFLQIKVLSHIMNNIVNLGASLPAGRPRVPPQVSLVVTHCDFWDDDKKGIERNALRTNAKTASLLKFVNGDIMLSGWPKPGDLSGRGAKADAEQAEIDFSQALQAMISSSNVKFFEEEIEALYHDMMAAMADRIAEEKLNKKWCAIL